MKENFLNAQKKRKKRKNEIEFDLLMISAKNNNQREVINIRFRVISLIFYLVCQNVLVYVLIMPLERIEE